MTHRIALIHAVRAAIPPVEEAFARRWPAAARMNLLDDSLSRDRNRDGELTPAMIRRFVALSDYALATGAAGILYTCSAQFSTARARAAVSAVLDCAVLTSPDSAVLCLRAAVNGEAR
jgi:hypothetical protein